MNVVKKHWKKFVLVFYVFLVLSIIYHIYYAKRIIPGVTIGPVYVGGMTAQDAIKLLSDKEAGINKKIVFKSQDKVFEITSEQLGFSYNWGDSVSRAFEVGRTGNLYIDIKDKIAGLVKPLYLRPFYHYEDKVLENELLKIKGEMSSSAEDAKFTLDINNKLTITDSTIGHKISETKLNELVQHAFDYLDYDDNGLPIDEVRPAINKGDLEPLLEKVKSLVSKDFKVIYDGTSWVLNTQNKLNLISFERDNGEVKPVLNQSAFSSFVNLIRQDVDVLPRGVVSYEDNGKVLSFEILQEGKELDVSRFTEDFKNTFFSDTKSVTVPTIVISNLDKDTYGIYALLGMGVSKYGGSSNSRIHNLTLAADKTNGVLVPPGSIYSFNKAIGAINASTGYNAAYVISGGRTVLGEGGGVCQTSTTLFRAVLNSGLPVVMRYAHDYRVRYYEIDSPVGLDAAIFQPSLDFQFKNDTPNYILIQSSWDLNEQSLTFRIYGTPDGRSVEMTEPVVTGVIAPPEALYQDDPTLAKGVIKQVDWSAWGASVSFTRTVKRDNEVISETNFVSRYQPWRAIFMRGTKE